MQFESKQPRYTAWLNTHTHKLDNIEARKRSPDGNPGPPSPSEVLVFNNTNHGGGGNRFGHNTRVLPEVPQQEEIAQYFKDTWNQKLREIEERRLTVLWIRRDDERDFNKKDGSQTPGTSQPPTPKQKNSPQHNKK